MCVIKRGVLSETEGDSMTSQAGHHGGGSQLHPNQDSVKNEAARKSVLSRLRALFQDLGSICFRWPLVFLYSMTFMLVHGEEQTGICELMDPAIVWDISSVVSFETIGLCPCSSTKQLPMQGMNICFPHGHLNAENRLPDPLGPPSPSRTNVKVVMTVLAIIGLAGWMLYKRWRVFTEADINRGLMNAPTVARRSNPTFEIHPRIH